MTMHWSATYVGIPWRDRGRDRQGCDCWGLARLVYVDHLRIALPSYAEAYPSTEEMREIDGLIRGALLAGPWIEVDRPAEFDLVLFRRGRFDSHVGIVAGRETMLHMVWLDAAKAERWSGPIWQRRMRGFFRHEARFEAGSKDR